MAEPREPVRPCIVKLVTIATSLDGSQNECQFDHLQTNIATNPQNLVKFGGVHSEIIDFIIKIIKNKEKKHLQLIYKFVTTQHESWVA